MVAFLHLYFDRINCGQTMERHLEKKGLKERVVMKPLECHETEEYDWNGLHVIDYHDLFWK